MSDASDGPAPAKFKIGCGCFAPLFLVVAVFWILWAINMLLIAACLAVLGSSREPSATLVGILAALATVGELLILLHPDVYPRIGIK